MAPGSAAVRTTPQGGCGCVNLAVPVFLLTGGATGFRVGYEYGIGWGLLGVVGGMVVGFIAFVGVLLLAAAGIALAEKVIGRTDEVGTRAERP